MFTIQTVRVTPEGDTLRNHGDLLRYILGKNGCTPEIAPPGGEVPLAEILSAAAAQFTEALKIWDVTAASGQDAPNTPEEKKSAEPKSRRRASRARPKPPEDKKVDTTEELPATGTPPPPAVNIPPPPASDIPPPPVNMPPPPPPLGSAPSSVPPIPTAGVQPM